MKYEIFRCDITGCKKDVVHRTILLQIIFTTDQTEGRSTEPYLTHETLDVCADCYERILQGDSVFGSGAMGHNTYRFRD